MGSEEREVITPGGPRRESSVHWVRPGQAVEQTAEGPQVVSRDPAKGGERGSVVVNTAQSGTQVDMVITPGGLRSSSVVHKIEAGTVLDGSTGSIRNLDAERNLLADFGAIPPKPEGTPLMPLNVSHPARPAPAFGTGWITYASWTNSTGSPVSSFSTQWIVPPPPIAEDGQVIFLFNGIQNSTMIYQPVLQWGVSAAGGGNYWAVACWYADGQGGQVFHSDLVRVNTDDLLTGIMTLTGQSGSNFSYDCSFQGIATSLPIQNIPELTYGSCRS